MYSNVRNPYQKEIERKRKLWRGWRLSVSPHLGPPRLKFWPLLLSSSNFMHFNAHLPFKWGSRAIKCKRKLSVTCSGYTNCMPSSCTAPQQLPSQFFLFFFRLPFQWTLRCKSFESVDPSPSSSGFSAPWFCLFRPKAAQVPGNRCRARQGTAKLHPLTPK